MNGIVMEKHRHYIIVMTDSGQFLKTKPVHNLTRVGAEISLNDECEQEVNHHAFITYFKKIVQLMLLAGSMLVFILPVYLLTRINRTYAYVNIDFDPSIELEVNKKSRVQSITAFNHDARILIEKLTPYKHKTLNEIMINMTELSQKMNNIDKTGAAIVGVRYAKEQGVAVLENVTAYLKKNWPEKRIVSFRVPTEVFNRAKEQHRAMNEVMAESLTAEPLSVKLKQESEALNKEEKAIIQTFYFTTNYETQ